MRWILLLTLLLVGCQSAPRGESAELPLEGDDPVPRSAWDYVRGKYDANRDGRITLAEYDRGAPYFERMDRDGDGVLTGADFANVGAHNLRSDRMARRVMVRYFSAEREGGVRERFGAFDTDQDGAITRAEFEVVVTIGIKARLWTALLAAADADESGTLSLEELETYARTAVPRAIEGKPAPDFTLAPPEGGRTVRLSSFRGDRPVALIFGSYT